MDRPRGGTGPLDGPLVATLSNRDAVKRLGGALGCCDTTEGAGRGGAIERITAAIGNALRPFRNETLGLSAIIRLVGVEARGTGEGSSGLENLRCTRASTTARECATSAGEARRPRSNNCGTGCTNREVPSRGDGKSNSWSSPGGRTTTEGKTLRKADGSADRGRAESRSCDPFRDLPKESKESRVPSKLTFRDPHLY